MVDVPVERFEELVADALDEIPDDLWRLMDNVAVIVREGTEASSLLGLYEGIPLTKRDAGYGGMVMPDRISIFRLPILAGAPTRRRWWRRCGSPSSTRWPTTSASTTTGSTSSAGREALRFRRAVLVEAAERGRGHRPRPPPALGVLHQVGRCSSWPRWSSGVVLLAMGWRRPRRLGFSGVLVLVGAGLGRGSPTSSGSPPTS